jgi:hypothetical protein
MDEREMGAEREREREREREGRVAMVGDGRFGEGAN